MIRRATQDDIPILRDSFVRNIILETYSGSDRCEAMRDMRGVFDSLMQQGKTTVLEVEGAILGWAGSVRNSLWGLYIKSPFRGRGLGRMLLDSVVEVQPDKILMVTFPSKFFWRWTMAQGLIPIWDYPSFSLAIKSGRRAAKRVVVVRTQQVVEWV